MWIPLRVGCFSPSRPVSLGKLLLSLCSPHPQLACTPSSPLSPPQHPHWCMVASWVGFCSAPSGLFCLPPPPQACLRRIPGLEKASPLTQGKKAQRGVFWCFPYLFTPKSEELSLLLASLLSIFSFLLAIPELTIDAPPQSEGQLQRQPLRFTRAQLQPLSALLETVGLMARTSVVIPWPHCLASP